MQQLLRKRTAQYVNVCSQRRTKVAFVGVLGFYFPNPNARVDRGLDPALHADLDAKMVPF